MPKPNHWKNLESDLNLDADADTFQFSSPKGKGRNKDSVQSEPTYDTGLSTGDTGLSGGSGTTSPSGNDDIWTMDAIEQRIFDLTNEFRIQNGKTPFQNDERLNAAADDWSETMAKGDFIGHASSAQVKEYGYQTAAWSENIGWGYGTAEAVVEAWKASPGHRAAMLGNYEEMGVGYYHMADDTGDRNPMHYYTQEFGTEADMLI
jgi:uncharacterized protein YkwD